MAFEFKTVVSLPIAERPVLCASNATVPQFCVSRGVEVLLYRDRETSHYSAAEANANVDISAFSQDSSILAVGLSNGFICLYHSEDLSAILQKDILQTEKEDKDLLFTYLEFTRVGIGTYNLLILTRDGEVYVMALSLAGGGSQPRAEVLKVPVDPVVSAGFYRDSWTIICSDDASSLSIWTFDRKENKVIESDRFNSISGTVVRKFAVVRNDSLFVTLQSDGSLGLWSMLLCCLIDVWNVAKASDLTLVSTGCDVSSSGDEMLSVSVQAEAQQPNLYLLDFPSLNTKATLTVSLGATIIPGCSIQRSMYFMEFSSGTGVRISEVYEANPKDRLQRLIKSRQFDEAEHFAKENDLSLDEFYKSKSQYLLENTEDLAVMLECLNKVSDVSFVCRMCYAVKTQDKNLYTGLLQYCQKRILDVSDASKSMKSSLLLENQRTLHRLASYSLMLESDGFNPEVWSIFMSAEICEILKILLMKGRLLQASLIWQRHQRALLDELQIDIFHGLFECIPGDSPLAEISLMCKTVIPFLIQHLPQPLGWLIEWYGTSVERLFRLDVKLPLNEAIESTKSLLSQVTTLTKQLKKHPIIPAAAAKADTFAGTCQTEVVGMLKKILSRLEELQYLHKELSFTDVTIEQISEVGGKEVVYLMLDKVNAVEMYSGIVKGNVEKYCKEHGFDVNQVLLDYIKHILTRAPLSRFYFGNRITELPWEAKILALLECIDSQETYLEGVCEFVKDVPVPWSAEVRQLVNRCLSYRLPQAASLKKIYDLAEMKRIAHVYSINEADLEYLRKNRPIGLVKIIAYSNSPSSLDDLLCIAGLCGVKQSEANQCHLEFLMERGKASEVECHLLSLDSELLKEVTDRLILKGKLGRIVTSVQLALTATKMVISTTDETVFSQCVWPQMAYSQIQKYLERMLKLEKYFSEMPSIDDLLCEDYCRQQVKKRISLEKFPISSGGLQALAKYSQLYQCSDVWLFCELIEHTIQLNRLGDAASFFKKLENIDISETDTVHLLEVSEMTWNRMCRFDDHLKGSDSVVTEILDSLLRLSEKSVVVCKNGDLHGYLDWGSACRSMCLVNQHCSSIEQEAEHLKMRSELKNYLFEPIYKEEALMLEQSDILPSVAQLYYSKGCFTPDKAVDLKSVVQRSKAVRSLLRENNLSQLALQCSLEVVDALLVQNLINKKDLTEFERKELLIDAPITHLIELVLRPSKLDALYSFALLLCNEPANVNRLLLSSHMSAKGYTKQQALANLAYIYAKVMRQQASEETALKYFKQAKWGKILRRYKIDFSEAMGPDRRQIEDATKNKLFKIKEVPLSLILEFCRDTQLVTSETLVLYLSTLLVNWKEGYEPKAVELLQKLSIGDGLRSLTNALSKVSPYDYKRLHFILQKIKDISDKGDSISRVKKGLAILEWLRSYKRHAPPGEYEVEYYLKHVSKADANEKEKRMELPACSSCRLPYQPLVMGETLKILGPELNVCNVDEIMQVGPLINITNDRILVQTIKNLANQQKPKNSTENKQLCLRLMQLIAQIGDLKTAVLCGRKFKGIVQGEGCIAVLQQTATLAKEWINKAISDIEKEEAVNIHQSVQSEVSLAHVRHLMENSGVNDPEAQSLLRQPVELVKHLYTVIPVSTEDSNRNVNIHNLSKEIAKISDFDLSKIKAELIELWLFSLGSRKQSPLDVTLDITQLSLDDTFVTTGSSTNETGDKMDEEEESFQRLVYLVSEEEMFVQNTCTLLNIAKRPSGTFPYKSQVMGLKVLLHCVPSDVIQEVSKRDVQEIMNYHQVLQFVAKLDSLNIYTDPKTYISCDKKAFVKGLLKNHKKEARVLDLVVDMMLFHKIFDQVLWEYLLASLMELKQVKILRRCVVALMKTAPDALKMPSLPDAWNCVLMQPLKDVSLPFTEDTEASLTEIFFLLLECPFLLSLDMAFFVKSYHHLGMKALALGCVYFITGKERLLFLKKICKGMDEAEKRVVKEELTSLPSCRQIYNTLFKELEECDELNLQ